MKNYVYCGVLPFRKVSTSAKTKDPWMRNFRFAQEYYLENGHLDVPVSYVTKDGVRLGMWFGKQRSLYCGTSDGKTLHDTQVQLLESLDMVWNPRRKAFETGLQAAQRYYEHNGNLNVPARYVDETGFPLFQWLYDVRKKKSKLQDEDIRYLESMKFVWEKRSQNRLSNDE